MYIILAIIATFIAFVLFIITYTMISRRVRLKPKGVAIFFIMAVVMLFLADTADQMREQKQFDERIMDIQYSNQ